MIRGVSLFLQFFILVLFWGCGTDVQNYQLENLNPVETGVDFKNMLSEGDSLNIIQYLYYYNGAGIGAGDFNNDGKTDLYFGANQTNDQLYLNSSEDGSIKFINITEKSGLRGVSDWTTGVTVVDINNDGLNDIYVCQLSGYKSLRGSNKLYINQGVENGMPTFLESAAKYGLAFEGLSTHAAFLDYDLDGDLDMYLLNHSVHGADTYVKGEARGQRDLVNGDRLYKNENGYYIDVTEDAGIYGSLIGYGLGVDVGDLDNNGYPDLYITNDFHEHDYLYLNNGDGTFTESIEKSVRHTSQFSMGVSIADVNNDGLLDIMSLDMMPDDESVRLASVDADPFDIYEFKKSYGYHYQLPRNHLQINSGNNEDRVPNFKEVGVYAGVEATDWSWSVLPGDYDNDGDKDLFVTNGILRRPNDLDYLNYISDGIAQEHDSDVELIKEMPSGKIPNVLLMQNNNLQFSKEIGRLEQISTASTAAISADLDNDGDLDIVTNNLNDVAGILENRSSNNKYLQVVLESKAPVIGTKVSLWVDGAVQLQSVKTSKGFMASYKGPMHFGLGSVDIIDSLIVDWSGGKKSRYYNVTSNQRINFNSDEGVGVGVVHEKHMERGFSKKVLPYTHIEDEYNDLSVQKLMPYVLSKEGPATATGDINEDGIMDMYVGGAHGHAGQLLLGNEDGEFVVMSQKDFEKHKVYEDVVATLSDLNGDNYLDLYVGSGGHRERDGSPILMDRIYINDGKGNFKFQRIPLSITSYNTSAVSAEDFDNDGDDDLLITFRVKGGRYGLSGGYQMLKNNGDATFDIISTPQLSNLGMITDAHWVDIDDDNDLDAVIVGEWMPVTLLIQSEGSFVVREVPNTIGLWQTIEVEDLDGDGDTDMMLGNFGLNNTLAQAQSAGLFICDYDKNNILDPIVYYVEDKRAVPLYGKDALAAQMNKLKSEFSDYKSFATADLKRTFNSDKIADVQLDLLASSWFEQLPTGEFEIHEFPYEGQFAPIRAIMVADIDGDSDKDLLLGGNRIAVSPNLGQQDASTLTKLYNIDQSMIHIKGQSETHIGGVITEIVSDTANLSAIIMRNNADAISVRIRD